MSYFISAVEAMPGHLVVTWNDGNADHFPWFWLRDHGEDKQSLDPDTLQRCVDTFSIPEDIGPARTTLGADNGVTIAWADGSAPTWISGALLARCAGRTAADKRTLWAAGTHLGALPAFDFKTVVNSDAGGRAWQEAVRTYGFAIVENSEPSEEGTRRLAERIGPAMNTVFGDYWLLSSEIKDHGDSAYTNQFLEPHTDSTYYHDAPGLQMFNCLEFDGKGGESTLVDGFAIALQMQRECPEHFDTLCRVVVPGRYLEPGVHLEAERPVFRLDRTGALAQISFNNYDRAPFRLADAEMQRFYAAYGEFHRRIVDQENWLKIPLRPGMALIFDNWRSLHGRMGYVGKRVFHGCYLSQADFESRLKVLRQTELAA